MTDIVAALGPPGLWVLFLTGMVLLVGPARIRELLSRLSRIQLSGVRIELESGLASAAAARGMAVPRKVRTEVAERLRVVNARMVKSRFLWIDDNPEGNVAELKILKALGATIDLACSDEEARQRLNGAVYDIVLSDIRRGGREDAGVRFLREVTNAILGPAVIFYVGDAKGTPPGAYGITTRPDELMHLIVDALLERSRV